MELVRGRTLKETLKRAGGISSEVAAVWFDEILEAVKSAHASGVIHRDLKPENILVETHDGGRDSIKILDFGLAKFTQPDMHDDSHSLTTPGVVMGTFGYMSPEQLTGGEVDARSDLFAIGVIIVEALTGRRPFEGHTLVELLHAMQRDSFRFPGDALEAARLDAGLRKSLAWERDERFASATEMQSTLIPLISDLPPSAATLQLPALDADTMILKQ